MKNKKQKNRLSKWEKRIILVQAVFVFGVFVYLLFSTNPSGIYPLQGMVISEPDFVFEIENGEQVVLSRDIEFSNPIFLDKGSEQYLPPGIYYWKVKSKFRESEVKNFTVEGRVGLDIREREDNYILSNSGNVDLNVTREKDDISSMIISVGENEEVEKDDSKYEGRQK